LPRFTEARLTLVWMSDGIAMLVRGSAIIMSVEKAFAKLMERIVELQTVQIRNEAYIAALIGILSRVIATNGNKTVADIAEEIQLECSLQHQKALERIENRDPTLAALLDARRLDQVP
jgi:hypothetical protein